MAQVFTPGFDLIFRFGVLGVILLVITVVLIHAHRADSLVLGFRRYRMDIPVSVLLPGLARMSTSKPVSTFTLVGVWVLLVGLAAINIAAAYLPIANWTWTITYPIAVLMMLLIMVYYMHLRDSTRLIRLFAAAGFFWLMLWFTIGLADYLTRSPLI